MRDLKNFSSKLKRCGSVDAFDSNVMMNSFTLVLFRQQELNTDEKRSFVTF